MRVFLNAVVVFVLILIFSACGKIGRSPTAPSSATYKPQEAVQVISFTPPSGSELIQGNSIQIVISVDRTNIVPGTVVVDALVFTRDDGMDLLNGCGGSNGGRSSISYSETVNQTNPFWARGHTFNAVFVEMTGPMVDFDKLTRPCVFGIIGSDGRLTGRVAWDKVQYRQDILLNWRIE